MLQLAPSPASREAVSPVSPLEQLDALANAELALLARAVGESVPCELVDHVLELRARRAALAHRLGLEPVLSRVELERLWAMPDLRTRRGKRDRALLMLLGAAGMRRAEACALTFADLEELKRHPAPRRRDTLVRAGGGAYASPSAGGPARSTRRTRRRGDRRGGPLAPRGAHRSNLRLGAEQRPRGPLRPRAVNSLVERCAARAGLPKDRRSPHVLRHAFCTVLAESGAGLEIVAELAGHADLRTTQGYVTVSPGRRAAAVHAAFAGELNTREPPAGVEAGDG